MYDRSFLIKMVQTKMPFGQYEGWKVTDLPVHYLEWFERQGFPNGQLGQYLATMYEIKTNGLESLLDPIKKMVREQRFR
ncbi:MAG: DUF3820 family protein [Balneolaceae bacterium]